MVFPDAKILAANESRDELKRKIRQAEKELQTAGPMHARDLRKHIKRLKRELETYDGYRTRAARQRTA